MRSQINVSSNQVVHILTKNKNTPTSFLHIVMQVVNGIFMTGSLSPQQLTSSMLPSLTGAPGKIWNFQKQFQCRNKSNVHRLVRSKQDSIFLQIDWLPYRTFIKCIWGKPGKNKNSLSRHYYSSIKATWRPVHRSPWASYTQDIWNGGYKIKNSTWWSQLQSSWQKKSQISYWPCD